MYHTKPYGWISVINVEFDNKSSPLHFEQIESLQNCFLQFMNGSPYMPPVLFLLFLRNILKTQVLSRVEREKSTGRITNPALDFDELI